MNKPILRICLICVKFPWFLLILLMQIPVAFASGSTAVIPTVKDIIALLERDHIKKLERGKIIAFEIPEATEKELALKLGMYIPLPPEKFAAFFKTGDFVTIDPDVTALGVLSPQSSVDAFKDFVFTQTQYKEAQDLLAAEPGDRFNLSAEEIQSLASLRKELLNADETTLVEKVTQFYRQMLWQRWQDYRKQGLSGIAPYARDDNTVDPTEELRLAAVNSILLARFSPDLQKVWLNYPTELPAGAEESYFWINRIVENRPTAILSHRILLTSDEGLMIVTRQFYVGHSYNSSHLIVVCVPYGNGSVVFYTHRTSTDQVAGFISSLKHDLGRKEVRKLMIKNLKRLRTAVHH